MRKTLEMDANFFLAHFYLGGVLKLKGRIAHEAIPEFQKAFDLNHDLYWRWPCSARPMAQWPDRGGAARFSLN